MARVAPETELAASVAVAPPPRRNPNVVRDVDDSDDDEDDEGTVGPRLAEARMVSPEEMVVAEATVISTQPALHSSVDRCSRGRDRVHSRLRSRSGKWRTIRIHEALAYSRSLSPTQYSAENPAFHGWHKCIPMGICDCVPPGCCISYNVPMDDDCICMPCIFCLCIVVPLLSCIVCTGCERSADHSWISRGDFGQKVGEWVIVDHEHGTLACYGTIPFTCFLVPTPCCYCVKM